MKLLPAFAALALTILVPILFRPGSGNQALAGTDALVIVTPHNEAMRAEFAAAFQRWYRAKHGRTVGIDFRTPGGTSEIARYLEGQYFTAFKYLWEKKLGRPWSPTVQKAFTDAKLELGPDPNKDDEAAKARRAFLESNVGCGIDLFFGGGAFDFQRQATAGRIVESGVVKERADLFPRVIPPILAGEPLYDAKGGRWFGTCLSAFGIAYNIDRVRQLGMANPPAQWADLAEPVWQRTLALANPTQSSSVNRAIEMLIQQQMNLVESENPQAGENRICEEGWSRAMRLLRRIGANARYFTDASSKIALDIESGEAAAGMTIDFYGRYQSESVRRPDGTSRLGYVTPPGGSSYGADPIALLRGAPNPEVAREFLRFCLLPEGQRLWGWKAGREGGPLRYALRRLPMLPDLYDDRFAPDRADPEVQPYREAAKFRYVESRTGKLFSAFAFVFRVMCIDTHDELRAAWGALIESGFPPDAAALFDDIAPVTYAEASGTIAKAVGSNADKIAQVRLAKQLSDRFRDQYSRVESLCRAAKR